MSSAIVTETENNPEKWTRPRQRSAEKANDILLGEKETDCGVALRSGANAEIAQRVLRSCDFIASRVSPPVPSAPFYRPRNSASLPTCLFIFSAFHLLFRASIRVRSTLPNFGINYYRWTEAVYLTRFSPCKS